ncbi:hypothetical protein [Streptomyces sp. NRRL B-24484]|uniref:hypothetical protein n=1 Tax=Streptomyces sp. NRRL B-24484 TaxID=1463833 RepID=UPI001331B92E|nr:hypothetical protein [Streptomyces sp. NRRL B-24484]
MRGQLTLHTDPHRAPQATRPAGPTRPAPTSVDGHGRQSRQAAEPVEPLEVLDRAAQGRRR